MSTLEERLLALRIPFMQIKLVGTEQQYKLKGNIVNVENDMDVCAKAIPRRFHEMATIQIKFSRRLADERPVWYEIVRPTVVEKAKNILLKTELYIENGVENRADFTNLPGYIIFDRLKTFITVKLNYSNVLTNFSETESEIEFIVPDPNGPDDPSENDPSLPLCSQKDETGSSADDDIMTSEGMLVF